MINTFISSLAANHDLLSSVVSSSGPFKRLCYVANSVDLDQTAPTA